MTSIALRIFVVLVDVAAVAALALLPKDGMWERPGATLLLVGLAALAGARPVRIPAMRAEYTATHPFIFFVLAAIGPFAAAIVALVGVVASAVGRGRLPRAIRFAFNVGAVVLSAAAAGWVFRVLDAAPSAGVGQRLAPLALAAATYFFANTGLAAGAIALDKGQSFFAVWTKAFLWTAVSFLTGLTLAVAMLAIDHTHAFWFLMLGLPPCWLMTTFFRGRVQEAR